MGCASSVPVSPSRSYAQLDGSIMLNNTTSFNSTFLSSSPSAAAAASTAFLRSCCSCPPPSSSSSVEDHTCGGAEEFSWWCCCCCRRCRDAVGDSFVGDGCCTAVWLVIIHLYKTHASDALLLCSVCWCIRWETEITFRSLLLADGYSLADRAPPSSSTLLERLLLLFRKELKNVDSAL